MALGWRPGGGYRRFLLSRTLDQISASSGWSSTCVLCNQRSPMGKREGQSMRERIEPCMLAMQCVLLVLLVLVVLVVLLVRSVRLVS